MSLTRKQSETITRMRPILNDLEARSMWQAALKNGSFVDAQLIGQQVVLFHYYAEGGVQHYVPGVGGTFDAMVTQLHQLAAL